MTHQVTSNADTANGTVAADAAAPSVTAVQSLKMPEPRESSERNEPLLDTKPRIKTFGERKFNWITYGGFALLGNEAASLVITKAAEDKNGNARGLYAPFKKFFTDMKGKRFVPEYAWNGGLPKVLIALIGGMMMVPFVKHMEDNKGQKVREYDRKHYGDVIDTDPAFKAAHKEMDEAPQQTWGSLWKGRLLTVFAAIGVDGLIGWRDAPSTKLFKPGSTMSKYSSMDRIADQVAEKTLNVFKVAEANRAVPREWLQRGSWLLVLSSTLTGLFYVSSKLFAKKRDEKIERRQHTGDLTVHGDEAMATDTDLETALTKVAERPHTKVDTITHDTTLANKQLAHSV